MIHAAVLQYRCYLTIADSPKHKLKCKNSYVQALDLSPGFSDFGRLARCFLICWGSGVNLMIERVLGCESRRESIAHYKQIPLYRME